MVLEALSGGVWLRAEEVSEATGLTLPQVRKTLYYAWNRGVLDKRMEGGCRIWALSSRVAAHEASLAERLVSFVSDGGWHDRSEAASAVGCCPSTASVHLNEAVRHGRLASRQFGRKTQYGVSPGSVTDLTVCEAALEVLSDGEWHGAGEVAEAIGVNYGILRGCLRPAIGANRVVGRESGDEYEWRLAA